MDSEYNGDVPELANHITQRVADKDTNILFHNKHFIKKIHWMVVSTASSIFSYELRGGERGELGGGCLGELDWWRGGKFATRAVLGFDILQ